MRAVVLTAFGSLFLLGAGRPILAITPPDVDLSLVAESEGMEPKGKLVVYVSVTNKSDFTLSRIAAETPSGSRFAGKAEFRDVGPFDSADSPMVIAASSQDTISLGKCQVLIVLRYHWKSPPPQPGSSGAAPSEGDAVRRVPLTVEVRAPYSEVASGLPGGSGPLFWLLLPVIPAFLAFQFVQGLRHKQGPQVPTFSAESVLPAFFIAVAVNSLPFWSSTLAKLNTVSLLAGSAVLGALWPSCLWIRDKTRWHRWGFRYDDTPESYFRKALLSRWVHRPLIWATGKVDDLPQEGFLLRQPDGSMALGTDLQVTMTEKYEKVGTWLQKLFDLPALIEKADRGDFWSRRKLVFTLRPGWIKVESLPTEDLQVRQQLVFTDQEVAGFKKKSSQRKAFLRCSA